MSRVSGTPSISLSPFQMTPDKNTKEEGNSHHAHITTNKIEIPSSYYTPNKQVLSFISRLVKTFHQTSRRHSTITPTHQSHSPKHKWTQTQIKTFILHWPSQSKMKVSTESMSWSGSFSFSAAARGLTILEVAEESIFLAELLFFLAEVHSRESLRGLKREGLEIEGTLLLNLNVLWEFKKRDEEEGEIAAADSLVVSISMAVLFSWVWERGGERERGVVEEGVFMVSYLDEVENMSGWFSPNFFFFFSFYFLSLDINIYFLSFIQTSQLISFFFF